MPREKMKKNAWPFVPKRKLLFTNFLIALLLSLNVCAQLSTAQSVASQMKVGWNLGNTMDAICGETAWGNPATSQTLIGLLMDGMGRTSNGSNCRQWANSGSWNQQWVMETAGAYVTLKNRATGLYMDGMWRSSNGSAAGHQPDQVRWSAWSFLYKRSIKPNITG